MRYDYFDMATTVARMTDGNLGATEAMLLVYGAARASGEDGQWPWEMIKICDELEIYGSRLYMLWNDCLGCSTAGMAKLAKAYRAGRISAGEIREHILGDGGPGRPFGELEGGNGA